MKPRVLFLCGGNSSRSQMAEGLMRHLARNKFQTFSACTQPNGVSREAVECMNERGIDISGFCPARVLDCLRHQWTHVIALYAPDKEFPLVFPKLAPIKHWNIEDPDQSAEIPAQRISAFRRVRNEIEEYVREFIADPR